MTNQTAALNEYLSYSETLTSPDKMLLIDSAEFQGNGNGQTVQRATIFSGRISGQLLVPVKQ
jgi:hypothetical protein